MIGVEVAQDEVIDFLEAGLLRDGDDALGVAASDLPARVVQQRFPDGETTSVAAPPSTSIQ